MKVRKLSSLLYSEMLLSQIRLSFVQVIYVYLNLSMYMTEIGKQFAVIARSRKVHTDQFRKIQIIREISDKFHQYISSHDISYVPPNFIIYLDSPHVQRDMLSEPTIRTQNFELDLLPWSREHELAQLPWIIGTGLAPVGLLVKARNSLHSFHNSSVFYIISILCLRSLNTHRWHARDK